MIIECISHLPQEIQTAICVCFFAGDEDFMPSVYVLATADLESHGNLPAIQFPETII